MQGVGGPRTHQQVHATPPSPLPHTITTATHHTITTTTAITITVTTTRSLSWDRTAYITKVATGEPSYRAKMNNVHNNFIIANYGSSQGFDTDDGSSWWEWE